jgi:branched-subunit amino acid transport protein AzlD
MNANVNTAQIIGGVKAAVSIAALVMVTIGCLKAFGVDVPYLRIGMTEIAALSAAAAYVGR